MNVKIWERQLVLKESIALGECLATNQWSAVSTCQVLGWHVVMDRSCGADQCDSRLDYCEPTPRCSDPIMVA